MKKLLSNIEENKVIFILINSFAVLFFLLLNFLTPLAGDDLLYQRIFGTTQRVESIGDIITSQYTHYYTWGGRAVVHFVDQFFLMYDKAFFNIANTIVFLLFVLLIYVCSSGFEIKNSTLLFLYAGLWFAIPGVGTSILWQTMSCNYLWGSTLVLILFTPYCLYMKKGSTQNSTLFVSLIKAIVFFAFSIIAGWTIEAGAAMVLFGILLLLIYQARNKIKIQIWEISGFIGGCCGYLMLIIAPGNFARAESVAASNPINNIIIELAYRIARETYYMLVHMGGLLFVAVLLFLVLLKGKTIKETLLDNKMAVLMFILSLVGVYVMTATHSYAERVLVTPICFCLMSICSLYKKIDVKKNASLIICTLCFLCIMMGLQGSVSVYRMRDQSQMLNIRVEYTSVE